MLPFGLGRSYGDSCLNDGDVLLLTTSLNHIVAFDDEHGLFRCEAGVSLDEVLKVIVPRGWFLPTTPGTKFVTVGGAIANDIHGKNHHRAGTFGCHITQFELLRSDGKRLLCSPLENSAWFAATIGGLGLTGLITWAEFKLRRVANAMIDVESVKFANLDQFFEISAESDRHFEYTVSWLDCLAKGTSLGRGIFMRGNHAGPGIQNLQPHRPPRLRVPIDFPNFALNHYSIKAFNTLYYGRARGSMSRKVMHYDPFFYPLDALNDWNRIYGRRGFFQYQFVVPFTHGHEAMRAVIARIASSGQGSFLAVLKTFGERESPGMLSFPFPGVTLALDFPNNGLETLALFDELDRIVLEAGGRLYPAKDARMPAHAFQEHYPRWREFRHYLDPAFSSSFWQRVSHPV
jgi:FAD/FMN-containing dehydrogenase